MDSLDGIILFVLSGIFAVGLLPQMIYSALCIFTNVKWSLNYQNKIINQTFKNVNDEEFNFMSPKVRYINAKIFFIMLLYFVIIFFLMGFAFSITFLVVALSFEDELEVLDIAGTATFMALMLATILMGVFSLFFSKKQLKKDFSDQEVIAKFHEYLTNSFQKYGITNIGTEISANGIAIDTALNEETDSWLTTTNRRQKFWRKMKFTQNEFGTINEFREQVYKLAKRLNKVEKRMQTQNLTFIRTDSNSEISFNDLKWILLNDLNLKFASSKIINVSNSLLTQH